jgi:NAD(P)-dependent dehydrogenase (short-subunit alcohol dehydrogenase family)
LINAAGISGPVDELADVDVSAFRQTLDVNVSGALAMCRASLVGMRRRGAGRIVNVISGLAHRVQPGLGAYSASKAALLHLSRVMDAENRNLGVRVFAIEPGVVRTAMNESLLGLSPTGIHASVIQMLESIERDPGFVEPEESAALIRMAATGRADDLAGDACSVYDPAVRARVSAGAT